MLVGQGRQVAARARSDAEVIDALIAAAGTPEGLYGRRKMTHHLRRAGHQVAFCTVNRLMRDLGMNGVRRGKGVRTTVPAADGRRAGDLLNRDFTAPAPNARWVADFTYCRTWARFVHVAFIVDVFAQRIVGWHAAADKPPRRARPATASLRRRQPARPQLMAQHNEAPADGRGPNDNNHATQLSAITRLTTGWS